MIYIINSGIKIKKLGDVEIHSNESVYQTVLFF